MTTTRGGDLFTKKWGVPSLHFPGAHPLNPVLVSIGERCKLPKQIWAEPHCQTLYGVFWDEIMSFVSFVTQNHWHYTQVSKCSMGITDLVKYWLKSRHLRNDHHLRVRHKLVILTMCLTLIHTYLSMGELAYFAGLRLRCLNTVWRETHLSSNGLRHSLQPEK